MVYQQPAEMTRMILRAGITKGNMSWVQTLVRGFLAGAFIAFGGLFSIMLASGLTGWSAGNPAFSKLLFSLIFPAGLLLVVLTGAELFTGNTMYVTTAVWSRQTSILQLLKNWSLSYLGNFAGSVFVAGVLAYGAAITDGDSARNYVMNMANTKCNFNWGVALLRGFGCNVLVTLSLYSAVAADDVAGKFFAIWPPIVGFLLASFEHSVANMFFIPLGLMYQPAAASFGLFLYNNLLPVTIGNIIAGASVGSALYFLYLREPSVSSKEHAAHVAVEQHLADSTQKYFDNKVAKKDGSLSRVVTQTRALQALAQSATDMHRSASNMPPPRATAPVYSEAEVYPAAENVDVMVEHGLELGRRKSAASGAAAVAAAAAATAPAATPIVEGHPKSPAETRL